MLYTFYPLIAAVLANFIAQFIKPFAKYFSTGTFDKYQFLAAGGFPSSHTSTMSALTLSFALKEGFESSSFMISFIMLLIISYDAMNVRLYAGKHIAMTQQLIDDLKSLKNIKLTDPIYLTKMKKILGHERFEVVGGLFLGLIVSLVYYILIGGTF